MDNLLLGCKAGLTTGNSEVKGIIVGIKISDFTYVYLLRETGELGFYKMNDITINKQDVKFLQSLIDILLKLKHLGFSGTTN